MQSRRKFLEKAIYTTPLVLSLAVRPAFSGTGYGNQGGSTGNGGTGSTGGEIGGGGGIDLGGDGVTPPDTARSRSGDKDPHDWWRFWRKL